MKLLFVFVITPLPSANGTTDTVNERIPVTNDEMEAHWNVDCSASWTGLLDSRAHSAGEEHCTFPEKITQQLKLCAFIYQIPGNRDSGHCRDFRSAGNAAARNDCRLIKEIVQKAITCEQSIPLD